MPLKRVCAVEECKKNYSELIANGFKPEQAYAITLNNARRAMHRCSIQRQQKIKEGKLFEE